MPASATAAAATVGGLRPIWGDVELSVPRLADGGYDLEIIDRWGRRQADVDALVGNLFLAGVSTRRLERLAEQLFGYGLSKAAVSEITKSLDAEVRAFRERAIPDAVRYLLCDGITAKVREVGVRGKMFLVAFGIHADGRREILGFVLADSESEANWRGFLQDLKARGLKGKALKLITIDGAKGLRAAVRDVYPLKPVQRCLVHKIRNVLATCKVRNKAGSPRACVRSGRRRTAAKRWEPSRPSRTSGSSRRNGRWPRSAATCTSVSPTSSSPRRTTRRSARRTRSSDRSGS